MSQLILDIKNLTVHFRVYGGYLKVLNEVNLAVARGEKVGLVGETGCGKTTTMKSVMGILPQPPGKIVQGKIFFQGKNTLTMKKSEIEKMRQTGISMIFQDPTAALNPVFTVGQQLYDVVRHSQSTDESHSRLSTQEVSIRALQDVSLPDPKRILENYPLQLSGGMRQRVCIALAIARSKQLLIADEPGTSLDVTIQDQILRLLNRIAVEKQMAIILISHSLGVIREWTNRVYVMYAGSIVEESTTEELFSNPLHPYTRALMDCVPRLTGGGTSEGIPGRIPDYFNPPSGCRFHPRCPQAFLLCYEKKPPLYRTNDVHQVACYLYQEANQ